MSSGLFAKCLTEELQRGVLAGAQVCICKKAKRILVENYGYADAECGYPMREDTILRIYSMTKPVTAVAVTILLERGIIKRTDSLSKFFPEYADMLVEGELGVVKANRPIYIQDLLNMTAGIVYPGETRIEQTVAQRFEPLEKRIQEKNDLMTQEVIASIASFPLAFQPGSAWHYGFSADVLGGIVSKVTGKAYGDFLREEIFEPLEMKDTNFYVPKEKQERLAQLYEYKDGKRVIDESRHLGLTTGLYPPAFESGGAGLFSTMKDYTTFAMMLAGGGAYKGINILKADSVADFSQSALTKQQANSIYFEHIKGYGYGNLMRVSMGNGNTVEEKGAFGWDGWTGGYFSVNPHDQTVLFFGTQGSGYSNHSLVEELQRRYYELIQ